MELRLDVSLSSCPMNDMLSRRSLVTVKVIVEGVKSYNAVVTLSSPA